MNEHNKYTTIIIHNCIFFNKKPDNEANQKRKYLRIVITAFRRLFASRFASHLRIYCWKTIAAARVFKYLLLINIHFHLLWIMEAISCFFIWNASSVSNNVFGNRINNFVLQQLQD